MSKSISYQHWDVSADQPYYDYIENGYNVLNSDDYLYLVGGWSGSFAQTLDKSKIFNGPYGEPYSPVTIDTKTKGDNPARNNPHVLGEIAAIWNDYGQNSTTVLQAYLYPKRFRVAVYMSRQVEPRAPSRSWASVDGATRHYFFSGDLQTLENKTPQLPPLV